MRSCPACRGAPLRFWRFARPAEPRLAQRSRYRLDRCASCGTGVLARGERAGESAILYEDGQYAPTDAVASRIIEPARRLVDRERLRFLRHLPARARVFEVGAGDARFLAALAEAGYDASGIEPSAIEPASGEARAVDVRRLTLEELAEGGEGYDAVVLLHVLEHLDDPEAALAKASRLLVPGGTLLVAVPNLASLQAALGGDAWFHQDVPRHTILFTRAGLLRLLERCGFRVERATTLGLDQTLLGMWQTLLNRLTLERNVLLRALKRQRPARRRDLVVTALAAAPLVPLACALELGAGVAGRGGALVVRASLARPA